MDDLITCPDVPRNNAAGKSVAGLMLLCGLLTLQSGCINSLVMIGKVLGGDPVRKAAFELATGVSLKDEEKRILVHVSSPSFLADEYGSMPADIQEELIRRMKRHKIQVLHADRAARVLDDNGGVFDPRTLARKIEDVDYITHIEVLSFSHKEPSSPHLYRGRANGTITCYEVRGEADSRHVVQVYQQRFQTYYPGTYPVPRDQTPENVFIRRFINHVADCLGANFYDVHHSELIDL